MGTLFRRRSDGAAGPSAWSGSRCSICQIPSIGGFLSRRRRGEPLAHHDNMPCTQFACIGGEILVLAMLSGCAGQHMYSEGPLRPPPAAESWTTLRFKEYELHAQRHRSGAHLGSGMRSSLCRANAMSATEERYLAADKRASCVALAVALVYVISTLVVCSYGGDIKDIRYSIVHYSA